MPGLNINNEELELIIEVLHKLQQQKAKESGLQIEKIIPLDRYKEHLRKKIADNPESFINFAITTLDYDGYHLNDALFQSIGRAKNIINDLQSKQPNLFSEKSHGVIQPMTPDFHMLNEQEEISQNNQLSKSW
ncbi:MAG: hypothetical protein EP298_06850 [Gammaproteobacteria bacterium]|nr:MAG: hypothetical protein EP298_06850 [Gammaproteobacteria bacterium]UTW42951.1 hypothetical protein KFE69_02085 [bacterium SCSIO 12844]